MNARRRLLSRVRLGRTSVRTGFRTRLTALIALIFTIGGVVLLGVQYLLVQQLLTSGMNTIASGCITRPTEKPSSSCVLPVDAGEGDKDATTSGGAGELGAIERDFSTYDVTVQQTAKLSEGVLSGLLTWSIVIFSTFVVIAVIAARWLSKRSLGRISEITAMTRTFSHNDRRQRLGLQGPDDEIKELGDTIDEMLDRLDDSFTRQSRFVAGASHELRTPLTTTRTLLEIPLTQGRVPADLLQTFRAALAANERSERLINALLTLARVTQERCISEHQSTDLSKVVANETEDQEARIRAAGLTLRISLTPHRIIIDADSDLITIAIANLLANSTRHNQDGGEILVTTGKDCTHGWVEIENSGPNLTTIDISDLTLPFQRGPETRIFSGEMGTGHGLGLSIVNAISNNYKGSLNLTPLPQGGMRARLSFPISCD